MQEDRFNSAQRLLEIIEDLSKVQVPGNANYFDALLAAFSEIETLRDAHKFQIGLIDIAADIKTEIESNTAIHNDWLEDLSGVFRICNEANLLTFWGSLSQSIDTTGIKALKAYSVFFTSVCSEKKISPDQLAEIHAQLDELFESVLDLENEQLKEVLLSVLEVARRCLAEYRIYGAKALEEPLRTTVGALGIQYKKEKPNADEKEVVDKVFSFAVKVGEVAGNLNNLCALGQGTVDSIKALF